MFQAFMIVLREGVEAFLVVAITVAYLRKTGQQYFLSAVWWGVAASVIASGGLGYFLWLTQGANQPLWEGIFASVTVVLVVSFVAHMWKMGPQLKKEMESELSKTVTKPTGAAAYLGILFFTVIMVSREGMETALLLFQVKDAGLLTGIALGVAAAVLVAYLWEQFGYLIPLSKFFKITAIFLLLFIAQVAVQAFHEFTEAGIFPNSEYWHAASEPFSTEGVYGKWYGNLTFFGCGLWLIATLIGQKFSGRKTFVSQNAG